jgi:hypothetical protein
MQESKHCKDCKTDIGINTKYTLCKSCAIKRREITNQRLETVEAKCWICKTKKTLKNFIKNPDVYKKKVCIPCYPKFIQLQQSQKKDKINPNIMLKKALSFQLKKTIDKQDTVMNYIGCNVQFLREWIEFNWKSDMSWNNFRQYWIIQHVSIYEDPYKYWNWSNLVPILTHASECINKNFVKSQLIKFKEKGSTTKWFSEELLNSF